jgi:hypothetical protein
MPASTARWYAIQDIVKAAKAKQPTDRQRALVALWRAVDSHLELEGAYETALDEESLGLESFSLEDGIVWARTMVMVEHRINVPLTELLEGDEAALAALGIHPSDTSSK